MKRSTKASLATGAAALSLLLGGAGTIAFWTDTGTVDGTTIATGHLKFGTPDCGAGWLLDGGASYTTQLLVPGDVLTKTCAFTLDAAGEHLSADFTLTTPTGVTGSAALADELDLTTAVTLNGNPQATTTDVPVADGDVVAVSMTLTWPYGVEDNDSNLAAGLSAILGDLTVVATQHHAHPA